MMKSNGGAEILQTIKFVDELHADAQALKDLWDGTQYTAHLRRAYVRAALAAIEGEVHALRLWALARPGDLKRGEREWLEEVSFQIDSGGDIVPGPPAFPELTKRLRFVFKVCARVWEVEAELDVGDSGWRELRSSIGLRNRLTHPRTLDDLEIKDQEMESLRLAARWFHAHSYDLLLAVMTKADDESD